MKIIKTESGKQLIMKITGRLDAYWSDHLHNELDNILREGSDRILLDLSEVHYISSAGIRVFLSYYRKLMAIQGYFAVTKISENARSVLEMSGLADLLIAPSSPSSKAARAPEIIELENRDTTFEMFPDVRDAEMHCRIMGDPSLLNGCRFQEENLRRFSFTEKSYGVGLGAFGETFDECRERFGEFVAASGTAVYLPTDGRNIPDYMVSTGSFIPEMNVLYGLVCQGEFRHHSRFEVKKDSGQVSLQSLVEFCLDTANTDTMAMVMIGECAGLLGAVLSRSPVLQESAVAPFGFPEIREWLSFSSDRSFARSLTLVVGLADRSGNGALAPFLRPMKRGTALSAHFHAAAFPFQPLKKGRLELRTTVSGLFESERIHGVMHLLTDDRDVEGAGESEFIRGACWFGPISKFLE